MTLYNLIEDRSNRQELCTEEGYLLSLKSYFVIDQKIVIVIKFFNKKSRAINSHPTKLRLRAYT
jgi:hypothetical protein